MKSLPRSYKTALAASIVIMAAYQAYSMILQHQENQERIKTYQAMVMPPPENGPKTIEEAIKAGISMTSKDSKLPSQAPIPTPEEIIAQAESQNSQVPAQARVAMPAPSKTPVRLGNRPDRKEIIATLKRFKGTDFTPILQEWASLHPEEASKIFLEIAKDGKQKPEVRYIAMLGAVKAGGPEIIPELVSLQKDRSYLVRYGVALALRFAKPSSSLQDFQPLLHDPAMTVREQAFHSFTKVSPEKVPFYALEVFTEPQNFVRKTPMPIVMTAMKSLQRKSLSQNTQLVDQLCVLQKNATSRSFRDDVSALLGSRYSCDHNK